jgi:Protein of unknown function (DUF3800)
MDLIFDKKANTTTIKLLPDNLIAFIDESGSEFLTDRNNPYFVVGGFCCDVKTFLKDLDTNWKKIKIKHFGTSELHIHANTIDIDNIRLIEDISNFFRHNSFARFAFSYGSNTINKIPLDNPQVLASDIASSIIQFNIDLYRANEAIIFSEKFEKRSYKYLEHLGSAFKIILGIKKINTKFIIVPVNKTYLLSGNEITDFICHAAGRQAKKYNMGTTKRGKDYECIFNSIDNKYINFFHFTSHAPTSPPT